VIEKIEEFRREIDVVDKEILKLMKKRFSFVKKIARLKIKYNLSIVQSHRWKKMKEDRLKVAKKMKLQEDFVSKIMFFLHKESIREQLKMEKNQK